MADFAGLTNAFTTITGSTAKANILIADRRIEAAKPIDPKPAVSAGTGGAGGISMPAGAQVGKIASAASGASNAIAGAAGSVMSNLGLDPSQYIGGEDDEYNKCFTVQFNPASLNITGYSGGSYDTTDFSEQGKSAKATGLSTNYSLSVRLIFDQMELQNSFPLDVFDYNMSTALASVYKIVNVAASGLSISVQAATEGLIGALYNPRTRYVCFVWGPMRYKGVLKSVNARYTMFDLMGRPVRSEVNLTLYLADKDIKQAGGNANLGMWANSYKKAFIDTAIGGAAKVKTATKIAKAVLGD